MILERIKQFIDYKGIAISAFEKSIGMANASFGKSLKKGGTIGADKLENILKVYPDLNSHWVITGEGNMINGELAPLAQDTTAVLLRLLAEKDMDIRALIEMLRKKDEQIEDLRNELDARKEKTALVAAGSSDAAVV